MATFQLAELSCLLAHPLLFEHLLPGFQHLSPEEISDMHSLEAPLQASSLCDSLEFWLRRLDSPDLPAFSLCLPGNPTGIRPSTRHDEIHHFSLLNSSTTEPITHQWCKLSSTLTTTITKSDSIHFLGIPKCPLLPTCTATAAVQASTTLGLVRDSCPFPHWRTIPKSG